MGGQVQTNLNMLFVFSVYCSFPNLIIMFGTNPNLTCVKKVIYIPVCFNFIILLKFWFSSELKVFIHNWDVELFI